MTDADIVASVARAEERRIAAMIAGDADQLAALLDDRLVFVHGNALVDDKARYLDAFRTNGVRYLAIGWSDRTITALGDTALLCGNLVLDLDVRGKPAVLRNNSLAVWARHGDSWRMIAYHSTPRPAA
jgi:ketosteroid isomerase-like protein